MTVDLSLADEHAVHLYDILKAHICELEKRAQNKTDDFDGKSIFIYGMMTGKAQMLLALLKDAGTDISQSSFEGKE